MLIYTMDLHSGLASRCFFSWFFFTAPFFPGGSDGKESACNAGVPGSIPGLGRSPEKGMATHSSILAWRTPWAEEPGGLQSMGLQRARHDLTTNTSTLSVPKPFRPHSPPTTTTAGFIWKTVSSCSTSLMIRSPALRTTGEQSTLSSPCLPARSSSLSPASSCWGAQMVNEATVTVTVWTPLWTS